MFWPSSLNYPALTAIWWVALLAAGGAVGYRVGHDRVSALWMSDREQQAAALLAANKARDDAETNLRKRMRARAAETSAAMATTDAAATGVGAELGRLRERITTSGCAASESSATRSGADGVPDARTALGVCAATLAEVAEYSDRLSTIVSGLRDYATVAQQTCGE